MRDPTGRREPQAFMSTDTDLEPSQIIAFFVRRWQIEVTFAETRAHLGVETQRQWSANAILRTTPSLLALYSLVTLWAGDILSQTTRLTRPHGTRKPISHSRTQSVPFAWFCGATISIDTAVKPGKSVWHRHFASLLNVQSQA